jgi:hypothetical protein
VCDITGYILPEVRHAVNEFSNTVSYREKPAAVYDISAEVHSVVASLLLGQKATTCRYKENTKQYARLSHHMHRQMRLFKTDKTDTFPNILVMLAVAMAQEKYWRFIEEASEDLARHCSRDITRCLLEIKRMGAKITTGTRLQELVCGMLYMLKNGLTYGNRVLLAAIPEIDKCLPHENKIEMYFGISSKVICMTENEVKLIFRESYQS